jgi:hypothetical protein
MTAYQMPSSLDRCRSSEIPWKDSQNLSSASPLAPREPYDVLATRGMIILPLKQALFWYSYSGTYLSIEVIDSHYDTAQAILSEADGTQSAIFTTKPELTAPHHSTPCNISPPFFPRPLTYFNETKGYEQTRLAKAHKVNNEHTMALTPEDVRSELQSLFLPFLSSESFSSSRFPGDPVEKQYVTGPELFSTADMDVRSRVVSPLPLL